MKGMFGGKLPSNLPPPPTGLPTGETPPSDTITIVMGKDKTLGIGLNNDNIVTSVTPNSVAGRHGLRLGDVIVGWQGQPLMGRKLQDLLRPAPVHILSVCRGGVLFKPMAEAPAPSESVAEGRPRRGAATPKAEPAPAPTANGDASPEKEEAPAPAPAPRSTRPKRGRAAREESEAPAPAAAEEEGGDDEEEEEEEEEEAPRRRPTRRAASAAKQRTADMMDTS